MTNRHRIAAYASCILFAQLAGCAKYSKNDVIFNLNQCPVADPANAKERSLGALVLALGDEGWSIMYIGHSEGSVRARKCHHRDGENCAMMSFTVGNSGSIKAQNSSGSQILGNLMDDVQRWKRELTTVYEAQRCSPPEEIRATLEKRGLAAK
jgi:hypothetical protein